MTQAGPDILERLDLMTWEITTTAAAEIRRLRAELDATRRALAAERVALHWVPTVTTPPADVRASPPVKA